MSENKRVTIPFLEKVLKPIVDLVHTKADKDNVYTKEDLAKVATSGSYSDLSDVPVPDITLTVEGSAADAKATGDAIELTLVKAEIMHYCPDIVLDPDVKILYDPEKTEIAASEFANNTEIEVVYFPNSTTVGQKAFEYATNLKYIVLPKATTLQNYSFRNCENLTYAYLPNVQSVAAQVFASTSQLKELDLPEVTSVKMRSFDGMSGLEVVSMCKLTKTSSSCFTLCPNLTNVNLPSVEELGGSDFDGCGMLIKMELPATKTISAGTFRSSGLTTLVLRNNILCTLGSVSALANTPIASGTGYIYVPAALIDSYKTATNWSTYAAQFRAIEDYPEICGEINLTVSMLDDTLSVEGAPADAKAVGDALAETGVWYVHATANDDGSFTLDKTYDDIIAAYNAGRKVQCEMRYEANPDEGAYIFDLNCFGPYLPNPDDGETIYNGALFVLWMQNRMIRMLITTDNQVMIFETNKFQTYGELQIRYGNELMYAGHMGVDVDIDLNIPINAPKDYVALRDHTNGYTYLVGMVNGKLVSTLEISELEIESYPNTMVYTAGDELDLTGLVVNAVRYDGSKSENIQVTHNAPSPLSTNVTSVTLSYNEFGKTYTVELPITVAAFAEEAILVDFDYTDNGDGTYTLTGWKGTNQGVPSTEMIIPNYSSIIL